MRIVFFLFLRKKQGLSRGKDMYKPFTV